MAMKSGEGNNARESKSTIIDKMKMQIEKLRKDYKDQYELDAFMRLYTRFIDEGDNAVEWDKIEEPKGKIAKYEQLKEPRNPRSLVAKLAVLKLNGGIGTTMGCKGPKSMIEVKDGKNFMDNVIEQMEWLKKKYGVDVPLVLMNSYSTEEDTKKLLKGRKVLMFNQSKFPRIDSATLLPISEQIYYPSGHGDMLTSIVKSGVLDNLLNQGKEYLFVSNIDNLAATVDLKILNHVIENEIDFGMELTDKTRADIKGGTLINYKGKLSLLEIAQVPSVHKGEFESIEKFKIFNTNSVWINLKALKKVVEEKGLDLDIIKNTKTVDGKLVIQLETAVGAAVKYFERNCGIVVPRSRFVPVKSCKDLFLLRSNLYELHNGTISINHRRPVPHPPVLRISGSGFDAVSSFEQTVKGEIDMVELESLTLVGNVRIGKNVSLQGTVIICATDNTVIDIPDGTILKDKLIFNTMAPISLK